MLMPKRTKFRKQQRGNFRGFATRINSVAFGDFGMLALEPKLITDRQIEAARVAMTRYIKRGGKVWIRIFPDKPYTKQAAETRMGKGKGNVEYWTARVLPGTVLFEIGGVEREIAQQAILLASQKLPIKTKFIERKGL